VTTYILADNMRDAALYASVKGMKRGEWKWPARSETLLGSKPTKVVTLPSYANRKDHHAITAVVRRQVRASREVKHVNVTQAQFDAMRASVDGAADEGVVLNG
jgi:hypothetical protein